MHFQLEISLFLPFLFFYPTCCTTSTGVSSQILSAYSFESMHPFNDPFMFNPSCNTTDDCYPPGVCVKERCRCGFGSTQTDTIKESFQCSLYHCRLNTACRYYFGLETFCDKAEGLCRCLPETYFNETTQSCVYNRSILLQDSAAKNRLNCKLSDHGKCSANFGTGSYCSILTGRCECMPMYWFNPSVSKCIQIVEHNYDDEGDKERNKDYTLFWLLIPGMALAIIYRMFPNKRTNRRDMNERPFGNRGRFVGAGALPGMATPDINGIPLSTINFGNVYGQGSSSHAIKGHGHKFIGDQPPSYQDAVESSANVQFTNSTTVDNESRVTISMNAPPSSPPAYNEVNNTTINPTQNV